MAESCAVAAVPALFVPYNAPNTTRLQDRGAPIGSAAGMDHATESALSPGCRTRREVYVSDGWCLEGRSSIDRRCPAPFAAPEGVPRRGAAGPTRNGCAGCPPPATGAAGTVADAIDASQFRRRKKWESRWHYLRSSRQSVLRNDLMEAFRERPYRSPCEGETTHNNAQPGAGTYGACMAPHSTDMQRLPEAPTTEVIAASALFIYFLSPRDSELHIATDNCSKEKKKKKKTTKKKEK